MDTHNSIQLVFLSFVKNIPIGVRRQISFGQSLFTLPVFVFVITVFVFVFVFIMNAFMKNTHKLVCLLTVAEQGPFILLLVLDKRLVDMVMIIMIIVMVIVMVMMMPMTLRMTVMVLITLTMTMTMAMAMMMN